MSNKTPIHVARAGTVIASIYKEGEHDAFVGGVVSGVRGEV